MFLHNPKMMYRVRVDEPNPAFAKVLLAQFCGPEGELAAAMRYFNEGWNEPDGARRGALLDIATEELAHLEMVAQTLSMLLRGSPSELVEQVEGSYLGDLLNDDVRDCFEMPVNSGSAMGGDEDGGPRRTDSMSLPWTAAHVAYIDTPEQLVVDLHSDIAAGARAATRCEHLIKQCDDAGCKDTLSLVMNREVAHQKMFQADLDSILQGLGQEVPT